MNIDKLIQCVNYILIKYNYSLNYTKLIKILYLADRESIKRTGWSITGDSYYNMPYGPVLSNTYKLIQGKHSDLRYQTKWDSIFLTDSRELKAKTNVVSQSELSQFEKELLDSVDSTYHDFNYSQMINVVHDKNICPEWKDPKGSSLPLPKDDIMKALGFDQKTIEHFREEEIVYSQEDQIISSLENI